MSRRGVGLIDVPLVIVCLLSLVAATAIWHYGSMAQHLYVARSSMLAMEGDLRAMDVHAQHDDIEHLRRQLWDTGYHVGRARTHLDRDPLLHMARWAPFAGDQVEALDGFLDIAGTIVELGDEGLGLGEQALALRDEHDGGSESLTATAITMLDEWGPQLDRMTELADRLVEQRIEMGQARLVGPLASARDQLDSQLPELAAWVDRTAAARVIAPDLLGFEGERRYLVLSQNNAQLLPGGGLVTVAGVMTIRDGEPVATEFVNSGDWIPQWEYLGGEYIEPPGPLRRHLLRDYSWNIGVSNWHPDFPTWAQQALEFYELAWGPQDVDGVIAVDLDVLTALLDITGPQTVEAPGYGDVTFDADNAFLELERVTRGVDEEDPDHDPEDYDHREKKAAVGELQETLLAVLLELPSDRWGELGSTLQELVERRHIQALFFDPAAQQLVRDLGWDGRLHAPEADYLHFSEASVASTKLNYVFQPSAQYRIEVTELGAARHELRLHYENTFDEWVVDQDPELVPLIMHGGRYGGYLRAFVPPDAVNFDAELDGRATGLEDTEVIGPHRWFGVFMPVAAGQEREVVMRWSVPVATTSPHEYRLDIQKQPGTRGMCIALDIHRGGLPATEIEITGGSIDDGGRTCLTTDVTVYAWFD